MRSKLIISAIFSSVIAACSNAVSSDLDEFHSSIEKRYSDIAHLSVDAYSRLDPELTVVFDTREPAEYAVSHLEGAIHLDPNISPSEFSLKYGELAKGKSVVFYCSVGERSSRVARRLKSQMFSNVYNLEKGVFGWHNEKRTLVRGQTATDLVHPYDEKWGKLVKRQEKVSYVPR